MVTFHISLTNLFLCLKKVLDYASPKYFAGHLKLMPGLFLRSADPPETEFDRSKQRQRRWTEKAPSLPWFASRCGFAAPRACFKNHFIVAADVRRIEAPKWR